MKNNVTLNSIDRELFGVRIKHRTKPNMLCLTDLANVYETQRVIHNWHKRDLTKMLNVKESPDNAERIYYVLYDRGLVNLALAKFIEECENKTLIKVLKEYGVYKTTGKGENKLVFASPDIFVLLGLELNPIFYAKTVIWLSDSLVKNRINAGDENNVLTSIMCKKWSPDASVYANVNRALNYIVYGRHERGIRNESNADLLKEMEKLQNNYSFSIDCGYIKTVDDLMNELRDEYCKRHDPTHKNYIKRKLNK